jgi:hypothetical protein
LYQLRSKIAISPAVTSIIATAASVSQSRVTGSSASAARSNGPLTPRLDQRYGAGNSISDALNNVLELRSVACVRDVGLVVEDGLTH